MDEWCPGVKMVGGHPRLVEHDGLVYGHSWRVARNVPTERGTAQFEIMAPSTYAGKHFHACEPCRNVLRAFAVIFVAVDEERTSDEIVAEHVKASIT